MIKHKNKCVWIEFHQNTHEDTLINLSECKQKEVGVCMIVDGDHAGDKKFCRSRRVFLTHVNIALAQWSSKKQSTVETSVLGAKFVAMKEGIDSLRCLKYKLKMLIFLSQVHHLFMGTVCQCYKTHQDYSQCSRRRAIQYAII